MLEKNCEERVAAAEEKQRSAEAEAEKVRQLAGGVQAAMKTLSFSVGALSNAAAGSAPEGL